MTLPETFELVYPSLVAFIQSFHATSDSPEFPQIIGTGFFVDSRGIVATNRHVVEAIGNCPWDRMTRMPMVQALVVLGVGTSGHNTRLSMTFLALRSYWAARLPVLPGDWFGDQDGPDIGFVQVEALDVPVLELAPDPWTLKAGLGVATAGFPTGTDIVMIYGRVSQPFPTLRRGIISSAIPFPAPKPQAFSMDIQQQGGSSGSPVFLPNDPRVIGLVHAGIPGVNYSLGVPAHFIKTGLDTLLSTTELDLTGVKTYATIKAEHDGSRGIKWGPLVMP